MAFHSLAWLLWLCAAGTLALANTQPLQSLLLILVGAAVLNAAGRHHPLGASWRTFLRAAWWAWGIALLFNLLFAHAGTHVLWQLPGSWPLVGGPITLEALLYGVANGAALAAVLLTFAAFNLGMNPYRLLRWTPSGLFQAGLIVCIALTFVPQLVGSLADIREAQRVRGHSVRGLRSLVPILVPLLTTALERSLVLAESMEARGFGFSLPVSSAEQNRHARWLVGLTMAVGLVLLLATLLLGSFLPHSGLLVMALASAGVAALVLALALSGQGQRRTRYRREVWSRRDSALAAACALSLGIAAVIRVRDPSAFAYSPYVPGALWPSFHPVLGLAALLLAAPVFLAPDEAPLDGAVEQAA